MTLETPRTRLRPWSVEDADACFRYASDPRVGPPAGWPPHRSVAESREIIENVLSGETTFAIELKASGEVVGSVGIKTGAATDLTDRADECELGYWLGAPHWGQGIMTEVVRAALDYAFRQLHMKTVFAAYYDGNDRSRRVQEKCGMTHRWTTPDVDVPLLGETRVGHVNAVSREEYFAARRVVREMAIDDYDAVWALWMSCRNMGFNDVDDSREGIAKLLARNPGLCYIAEIDGALAGVILAGQDGRRGYIYHMAVAEAHRREGVGTALVEHCLEGLRVAGISKAALLAFKRNEAGNAFWEAQGFELREDLNYRNKALKEMTRIDT